MTKLEFETTLKHWCPWLDDATFLLFDKYKKILQAENQRLNLTRLDGEDQIYEQYFLSSLKPFLLLNILSPTSDLKIIDVGSGSGIPGVVLKIIFRNLKVTLLDSNNKRCLFLRKLIQELGLQEIEIINDRCEHFMTYNRNLYDIATSRAVASLNKILELSVAGVKVGGLIISLKSQNYNQELLEAQNCLRKLHLEICDEQFYTLYGYKYVVTSFKKKRATDSEFPREWIKIIKNPL